MNGTNNVTSAVLFANEYWAQGKADLWSPRSGCQDQALAKAGRGVLGAAIPQLPDRGYATPARSALAEL